MKQLEIDASWPETWKESHLYDQMEIHGEKGVPGYRNAYRARQRHTLQLVKSVTPKGGKILDIAAAQGNFTLTLAEMGYDVTWNDLRAELMDYVRLKHERGTVHYAPGNAFDLEFEQLFDTVLITEIIEHVAHPDEFLKSVAQLVKPGGHIVMSTPNGGYFLNSLPKFSQCEDPSQFEEAQFQPNSDGHIFLIHQDELDSLAAHAGVELKAVRLFTNALTNGHMKTGPLLKVLPPRLVQSIERASVALPAPLRRKLHAGMAAVFAV